MTETINSHALDAKPHMTAEPESQDYRKLDPILPGERQAQAANDWLRLPADLLQAACHTAIQTPINSAAQMLGPDHLPPLHIVDAPQKVELLSSRWHAQQIGSALGAACDLAALDLLCRGKLPPAALGACYDGLMRPVESAGPLTADGQITLRFKNAAIGGVGLGTLGAGSKALASLESRGANTTWKSLCQNKMLTSTIAGVPAGLVTSALSGARSPEDLALGAYTSAFTGMSLGALHAAGERQALSRRRETELAALREAATTDHLTRLANRRGSDSALQKEFDQSTRSRRPLSVLYGDLDGFKAVNDHLGHEVGDHILMEVSKKLKGELRSYDHAGRTGGDEFTLVLPDTEFATALAIARRIEKTIKIQAGEGNQQHLVGISLGVATRLTGDKSPADLLKRADQDMYSNKKARKAQFNLFR